MRICEAGVLSSINKAISSNNDVPHPSLLMDSDFRVHTQQQWRNRADRLLRVPRRVTTVSEGGAKSERMPADRLIVTGRGQMPMFELRRVHRQNSGLSAQERPHRHGGSLNPDRAPLCAVRYAYYLLEEQVHGGQSGRCLVVGLESISRPIIDGFGVDLGTNILDSGGSFGFWDWIDQ